MRRILRPVALAGVGVKVDAHVIDPIETRRPVVPASTPAICENADVTASLPASSPVVAQLQQPGEVTLPLRLRKEPASVVLCVRLMYVGAALSVLAAIAELQARAAIRAALVEQNLHSLGSRLSATDITDAANFTVTFMVCAACASAVLWLVIGWGIHRGSGRARMIGTMLAVLCVLKVYGTLTQGGASMLGIGVDLLQLPVACMVTVLAWSGRSATHFADSPRAHR